MALYLWAGVATAQVAVRGDDPAALVLAKRLADTALPCAARVDALVGLQERGALGLQAAVTAMADADPELAAAAAAVVRHTWRELPAELFAELDQRPSAARLLLAELAIAPRPAAVAWAMRVAADPEQASATRCLALAAAGRVPGPAAAELLVTALLDDELLPGVELAIATLPSDLADTQIGRLHQALVEREVPVARALPLIERLSPRGLGMLLSSAVALPAEPRDALCRELAARGATAYFAQAAAALDGKLPLEAHWLFGAERLLDVAARRQRLLAALAADADGTELQQRAFAALSAAGGAAAELWAFAARRAARDEQYGWLVGLLEHSHGGIDPQGLLVWLDGPPPVAQAAAQALLRVGPFAPELAAALRERVCAVPVVGGPVLTALALALLRHGDAATVRAIWPHLVEADQVADFVAVLRHVHPEPACALLRSSLASATGAVRRELLLGLAALGDGAARASLVAESAELPPRFLARCAELVCGLSEAEALRVLDRAAAGDDDEACSAAVEWAAGCASPLVVARLLALTQDEALPWLQESALAALAAGPARNRSLAWLRRALRGPMDDAGERLAYAVLAGMPTPLASEDLRWCAEILLHWPLADAPGEAQHAARWPDGRRGFSLAVAVAERLRGTDPEAAAAVFAAVVQELVVRPATRTAIAPQRLLVFWRSLAREPELQQAIGAATAPLFLALREVPALGTGPGHWFLAMAEGGDRAASARRALGAALRHPDRDRLYEPFGGERAPRHGVDGLARLAALPHLAAAAAAQAAGDETGYTAAVALAREFAGRDTAALDQLVTLLPTNPKDLPR